MTICMIMPQLGVKIDCKMTKFDTWLFLPKTMGHLKYR